MSESNVPVQARPPPLNSSGHCRILRLAISPATSPTEGKNNSSQSRKARIEAIPKTRLTTAAELTAR